MEKSGNTLDPVALVNHTVQTLFATTFSKKLNLVRMEILTETRFINILNADLANDLGNLLNRTLNMAKVLQRMRSISEDIPTDNLEGDWFGTWRSRPASLRSAGIQACKKVLTLVRASNKFIDEQAPGLYKQGQQVEQVLYAVLESVRLVAYLLSPIIPNVSSDIYKQLGFPTDFNEKHKFQLPRLIVSMQLGNTKRKPEVGPTGFSTTKLLQSV